MNPKDYYLEWVTREIMLIEFAQKVWCVGYIQARAWAKVVMKDIHKKWPPIEAFEGVTLDIDPLEHAKKLRAEGHQLAVIAGIYNLMTGKNYSETNMSRLLNPEQAAKQREWDRAYRRKRRLLQQTSK
jgi:hypothetical protein